MNLKNINNYLWDDILANSQFQWQPPLTVHLPIQPVHSPDFIQVDSALNAARRRVYPKLTSQDGTACEAARTSETLIVQFAFDDPPFVPDFHCSKLTLVEDRYPIAQAEYFAWDIFYQLEYSCHPLGDEGQNVLGLCGTVTNEGETPQTVHVRVKVNFQRESDLFDYHYVPFYWDVSKWLPSDLVSIQENQILRAKEVVGKLVPGEFSVEWEAKATFRDKQYNRRFGCGTPYFVSPNHRLKKVEKVLHFHAELAPGEQRTFALALLTNYEQVTEEQRSLLVSLDLATCRDKALGHFKATFPGNPTELCCQVGNWDAIFTELQLSTLQLLVRFPGETNLMPTQGGSSERHFVWVWEAVCMLKSLLPLGHFQPVRQALDFIFSLQDGGFPPEGEFTTLEGAIGTTGPRWINSTGSALALAAEYYRYSKDQTYLETYLPKILRAANWIVGELRATRQLNLDGTRPLAYGLMPFGCGTDGDIGYIVAFTDAYTFWGLEKTVELLEQLDHTEASQYRRELEQYRLDLAITMKGLTRSDGYIERKVSVEGKQFITRKFENGVGVVHLAFAGVMDIQTEAFRNYLNYCEENLAEEFFLGTMDREVVYMGVSEWIWQDTYLRLGEWKKAFMLVQSNLKYGMTQDTHQVQERFSRRNPAYTCWQPNGSGNGRVLDMMIKSFYFERDGMVTLLGGIPFAWLRQNQRTALRNLHTTRGSISLEAEMTDAGDCRLVLAALTRESLPSQVRFPYHFDVRCDQPDVFRQGAHSFMLTSKSGKAVFLLSKNSL